MDIKVTQDEQFVSMFCHDELVTYPSSEVIDKFMQVSHSVVVIVVVTPYMGSGKLTEHAHNLKGVKSVTLGKQWEIWNCHIGAILVK